MPPATPRTPLALFDLDGEGRVGWLWNRSAADLFGLTAEEARGQPAPFVLPGFEAELQEVLEKVLGGASLADLPGQTMPTVGPSVPVRLTFLPRREGGAARIHVLVRPLALGSQGGSLPVAAEGPSLAAGVAHDLNNLLAGILGNAELLLRDPNLRPDQRGRLETMVRGASRGRTLASQLVALGRAPQRSPTALNELAREALALAVPEGQRLLTLCLDLDPDLPVLAVDPIQIHQVLMNLLVNARDAMGAGGTLSLRTGRAAISAVRARDGGPTGFLRLEVQDTGGGIPRAVQARMWEPFFTTKGVGSGLGLSVVQRVVQAHGGFVRCSSRVGEGTLFQVLLPHP